MKLWAYVPRAISVYQFLIGILGILFVIINASGFLEIEHGKADLLLWIFLLGILPCYAGLSLWSERAGSSWRRLFPSLIFQTLQSIWFSVKGLSYWYWNIAATLIVGRTSQGEFYTVTYFGGQPKVFLSRLDWHKDIPWWKVPSGPWLNYPNEPFVGFNLIPLGVLVCLLLGRGQLIEKLAEEASHRTPDSDGGAL